MTIIISSDTKVRRKGTFMQWQAKGAQLNYGVRLTSEDEATKFEDIMARAVQAAMDCLAASARDTEASYRLNVLSKVCVSIYV